MKKIISIGLLLLLCAALTGCGKSFIREDDIYTPPMDNENLIMVGVSQIGSESVWRTANSASIQQTFTRENGYFLIFDNARQKQENQIKAIRSFISQQVDYIVFSPITEEGWDSVLREAKDAGIPVILMDRQVKVSDPSLYTAWVGSNFEQEGIDAGEWLEKHLVEQGIENQDVNIVVLLGTEGATAVIGRSKGFGQVVKKNHWNVVEYVEADYTTAKAEEQMRRVLKEHPEVNVVVSQNDDMTFGALTAIEAAGRKAGITKDEDIVMISFDACKAALELVEQGIIGVDVECNPNLGEYVQRIIEDLEAGKTVEKNTYSVEKSFTKDMVSLYIEERTY